MIDLHGVLFLGAFFGSGGLARFLLANRLHVNTRQDRPWSRLDFVSVAAGDVYDARVARNSLAGRAKTGRFQLCHAKPSRD
jgi:hypothetical protein